MGSVGREGTDDANAGGWRMTPHRGQPTIADHRPDAWWRFPVLILRITAYVWFAWCLADAAAERMR